MNYAQAKEIAAEHAPDLILDEEVKGQAHICVRATKDGPPFSIHLPMSTDNAEADRKVLTDALDSANRALGM